MPHVHLTYELYLDDGRRRSFEALTCASQTELMTAVRNLIEQRGLKSVEVCQFGEHLFTIGA